MIMDIRHQYESTAASNYFELHKRRTAFGHLLKLVLNKQEGSRRKTRAANHQHPSPSSKMLIGFQALSDHRFHCRPARLANRCGIMEDEHRNTASPSCESSSDAAQVQIIVCTRSCLSRRIVTD